MLLNTKILKYKPSLVAFAIFCLSGRNIDPNFLEFVLSKNNEHLKFTLKKKKFESCCLDIVNWIGLFKSDPNFLIFDSVCSKYDGQFLYNPREILIFNLSNEDLSML